MLREWSWSCLKRNQCWLLVGNWKQGSPSTATYPHRVCCSVIMSPDFLFNHSLNGCLSFCCTGRHDWLFLRGQSLHFWRHWSAWIGCWPKTTGIVMRRLNSEQMSVSTSATRTRSLTGFQHTNTTNCAHWSISPSWRLPGSRNQENRREHVQRLQRRDSCLCARAERWM